MRSVLQLAWPVTLLTLIVANGCATTGSVSLPSTHPTYELQASANWPLNLPGDARFDASGLLFTADGELLTINDKGPTLYRINFSPATNGLDLIALTNILNAERLAPFAKEKHGYYDCEGLARDDRNRLYICEEADRWILRYDPASRSVERLNIDWSPVQRYFSPTDGNASFEGVAVGEGKLLVANERSEGRIIVVDLQTLKVIEDFVARPSRRQEGDVQYSDLSWFDGSLFALLRRDQVILKIDPKTHEVLAEYNYREMENAPGNRYFFIPIGLMEGLAVDKDYFWLVTDNNGLSRSGKPGDRRPTLFKCPRPDRTTDP